MLESICIECKYHKTPECNSDNCVYAKYKNEVLEQEADNRLKSLKILYTIAKMVAEGEYIKIAKDLSFGTATVVTSSNSKHMHIGYDGYKDDQHNFTAFIDGLYGLLVKPNGEYEPHNDET